MEEQQDQGQEQILNDITGKLGENWREVYLPSIAASIGGDAWRENFLGDSPLKDDPTLGRFKNIQDLAKTTVEQRATMGRWATEKGILRPKEGAPPKEVDEFYMALGRPEKPEHYEIGKPEQMPEGFPYSPELESGFRQWAFEEGLSAAATKNIFNKYLQANIAAYQQANEALQNGMKEVSQKLQQEWGDKYQENFAMAQAAAREFAPAGSAQEDALDRLIGDNPVLIQMWSEIGRRMGEADLLKGSASAANTLQAEKERLSAHPALLDKMHPEHELVTKQFNAVIKKMVEADKEQAQGAQKKG